jgi:hypothetical protein
MSTLTKDQILQKHQKSDISQIKNINFWGCDIEDLSILKDMQTLEVISLSVNKITTLKHFEQCKNLTELYLRKNFIADLEELNYLSNIKNLKILWLGENPCCEDPNYRIFTIKAIPSLLKLDNIPVSKEEREDKTIMTKLEKTSTAESLSELKPLETRKKRVMSTHNNKKKLNEIYETEVNSKIHKRIISPPKYSNINDDYMKKFKNLNELQEFFSNPINEQINRNSDWNFGKNQLRNNSNQRVIDQKPDRSQFETNLNSNNKLLLSSSKGFGDAVSNIILKNMPIQTSIKQHQTQNSHIIRAVTNLLEEMNLSQLNYLKRIIEKKLQNDPSSII